MGMFAPDVEDLADLSVGPPRYEYRDDEGGKVIGFLRYYMVAGPHKGKTVVYDEKRHRFMLEEDADNVFPDLNLPMHQIKSEWGVWSVLPAPVVIE